MKIYLQIINNQILSYNTSWNSICNTEIEITEAKLEELNSIGHHKFNYIDGAIIFREEEVREENKQKNITAFRNYRAIKLAKYDLLRQGYLAGDYDPITGTHYLPLTEEEKLYRVALLNFTSQITSTTTENDYPQVPARLR